MNFKRKRPGNATRTLNKKAERYAATRCSGCCCDCCIRNLGVGREPVVRTRAVSLDGWGGWGERGFELSPPYLGSPYGLPSSQDPIDPLRHFWHHDPDY